MNRFLPRGCWTTALLLFVVAAVAQDTARFVDSPPVALTGAAAMPSSATPLTTGKFISSRLSPRQLIGSLPMNLIVTPDRRFAITCDMGNRQALWTVRTDDGVGISHVDFQNKKASASSGALPPGETGDNASDTASSATVGLYYGLALDRNHTLYAAQGAHDRIAIVSLDDDGSLALRDHISTKAKDFPAGLAIDDARHLYVANNASGSGNPLNLVASIAIYDSMAKKEIGRFTFKSSHGGTSNFPFGICVLRDGSRAYVAAERDDCVYVLDTSDPTKPTLLSTVATGSHPVALLLSQDQSRLYVANSLSDTISIVDTKGNNVVSTVLLRPLIVRDIPGTTPTALALSPNGTTLYVAVSDMNAIAVIDVASQSVRGYIPAGWYPSAIAVVGDGKRLLVANAKGTSLRNPNDKPDKYDPRRKHGYILNVLEGNVSLIEIPSGEDFDRATEQVLKNNKLDVLASSASKNPLADIGISAGKIKHVIYIVKENRTYDEVLGDVPQGNGDPSLVLFGKDVTPNQHALADRFVLLDNLYACGEVSGDGWVWSTQGMADAYVVRNVPYNYSGRGRRYDFEGENNSYPTAGLPAKDEKGTPWAANPAFKNGLPAIPDVANTGRNIWDSAREAAISLRNYGFFLYSADGSVGLADGPDNYPTAPGLLPPGHDLAGVTDIDYRRFDLDYPDSNAPNDYFKKGDNKNCLFDRTAYGKREMPSRFAEWNREFQMMLTKDAGGAAVPALMLIRLPTDHTVGAKSGKHTPKSYVADNDYGLGQIVETISHSPIWASTAIVVIEDDAQSGGDHVDAHRTTAFVISPWIRTHSVDHRFYNTDSMLKTIELLLGLKPLSQFDAVADPIMDWDSSPANADPYHAILPSAELVGQRNPNARAMSASDPRLQMALRSGEMDFTHADAAPAQELNEIIWKSVKGVDSHMPAARGLQRDDD